MPCDSSHMKPSTKEIELSRVACLLDELDGRPWDRSEWYGYHPTVYNKFNIDADKLVSSLCTKLQSVDVTKYSLEMQMWWRDHQEVDKKRLQQELSLKQKDKDKQAALAKLTDYEKNLLGL